MHDEDDDGETRFTFPSSRHYSTAPTLAFAELPPSLLNRSHPRFRGAATLTTQPLPPSPRDRPHSHDEERNACLHLSQRLDLPWTGNIMRVYTYPSVYIYPSVYTYTTHTLSEHQHVAFLS